MYIHSETDLRRLAIDSLTTDGLPGGRGSRLPNPSDVTNTLLPKNEVLEDAGKSSASWWSSIKRFVSAVADIPGKLTKFLGDVFEIDRSSTSDKRVSLGTDMFLGSRSVASVSSPIDIQAPPALLYAESKPPTLEKNPIQGIVEPTTANTEASVFQGMNMPTEKPSELVELTRAAPLPAEPTSESSTAYKATIAPFVAKPEILQPSPGPTTIVERIVTSPPVYIIDKEPRLVPSNPTIYFVNGPEEGAPMKNGKPADPKGDPKKDLKDPPQKDAPRDPGAPDKQAKAGPAIPQLGLTEEELARIETISPFAPIDVSAGRQNSSYLVGRAPETPVVIPAYQPGAVARPGSIVSLLGVAVGTAAVVGATVQLSTTGRAPKKDEYFPTGV